MYIHLVKPVIDRLLALIGLVLLLPLLLLLTLWLVITTTENPIFCQLRIGYQGKLFKLYKFRTMTNARNQVGNLLPDIDRTTPIGHWLRRTSIDELPQLFNVLIGDMSLVGPRPLLAEYAPALAVHERHDILPGITGWAQVHGRNHLGWGQKFALDNWYIAHCSFLLDCRVIWRTLPVLVDTSPPAISFNDSSSPK